MTFITNVESVIVARVITRFSVIIIILVTIAGFSSLGSCCLLNFIWLCLIDYTKNVNFTFVLVSNKYLIIISKGNAYGAFQLTITNSPQTPS